MFSRTSYWEEVPPFDLPPNCNIREANKKNAERKDVTNQGRSKFFQKPKFPLAGLHWFRVPNADVLVQEFFCGEYFCDVKIYQNHPLWGTRYDEDVFRVDVIVDDQGAMDLSQRLHCLRMALF